MFRIKNEYLLYNILKQQIYLKSFNIGELEISLTETVPSNFLQRIKEKIKEWTGDTWQIKVSNKDEGSIRIVDLEQEEVERIKSEFQNSVEFKEITKYFPGVEIIEVKKKG